MKTYEEFKKCLQNKAEKWFNKHGVDCLVEFETSNRINTQTDSLVVDFLDINCVKAHFHIDQLYKQYLEHRDDEKPFKATLSEITSMVKEQKNILQNQSPVLDMVEHMQDWPLIPIVFDRTTNEEYLQPLVYRELGFGNLVETFAYVQETEQGMLKNMLTVEIAQHFGLPDDPAVLHEQVWAQLPERYRMQEQNVADILGPMAAFIDDVPLQVLTNSSMKYGAACLASPEYFMEAHPDTDLIIFPSSIHELLLLPMEEAFNDRAQDFASMVRDINRSEVAPRDKLSDTVFCWDSARQQIMEYDEYVRERDGEER